jgi:parallel beta-helix repeat protein
MLRKLSVVLLSAGALALAGCPSNPQTDAGVPVVSCTTAAPPVCTVPAGALAMDINNHVSTAAAGTTFNFKAGTFAFTSTVAIPKVDGLSFNGAGKGQTIFEFTGETTGDGFSAVLGNANLRFANFTLQNAAGNGIKVELANGVSFEGVEVRWVNPGDAGATNPFTHGPYGIYPVQCQNVLIDNCTVSGARDTGAYVGQSFNVVVSNTLAYQNVAGIEIESSENVDVHDNHSTQNSAGILVFALPGLQPPQGSGQQVDICTNVRVYNNQVDDNNTPNFADMSGTVASVPGGSGIVLLAANYVELFSNTVTNNGTLGYAVASYLVLDPSYDPTNPANNGMNPFPSNTYAHNNTFSANGASPQAQNPLPGGGTYTSQLGQLFAVIALEGGWTTAPDLIWDGIGNPQTYTPPSGNAAAGTPPNPLGYFIQGNSDADGPSGAATFGNVNLGVVCATCGTGGAPDVTGLRFDAADFTVSAPPTGFPLPAVDAGITP